MNRHTFYILLLSIIAVGLSAVLVIEAVKQGRQWEAFKVAHECRVTQRVPADTVVSMLDVSPGGGNMVVSTSIGSARVAWTCNDGITYWRTY